MHRHNCWVEWLTTGCIRFFPIGYLCGFGFCIAWDVSHNINPHKRSKNGSKIEAIIDNDLLSIEAKTFNAKSTMLAMFVTRIAILSPCFISSWQSLTKKKKNQFLFSGKRDKFYLKIDFFFSFFFFFLAALQKIIKRERHRKINREGNEQNNNLVHSFRVLLWITIMYL